MSLSEAFSREILQSQCSHNVIATSHGSIITVRLPCKQHQFALSVCVDRSENLAMALRMTLDAAQALADTIDNCFSTPTEQKKDRSAWQKSTLNPCVKSTATWQRPW